MLRDSRDKKKEQENKRTKGMGERTKKRGGNKRGKKKTGEGRMYIQTVRFFSFSSGHIHF